MSSTPPRRVEVEPVETTVKFSNGHTRSQTESLKPRRRFPPELVEITTKYSRRLAPEPVGTTERSSRRLAPQPVETTVKSCCNKDTQQLTGNTGRRFKPEPIETIASSSRKQEGDRPRIVEQSSSKLKEEEQKREPRRFAPQLIETAKRSRKAGDTNPAILPSDKTEAIPGDSTQSLKKTRIQPAPAPPENTPIAPTTQNPLFLEIERGCSPLLRRRLSSRSSTRSHHSFRVPELDPIESSESDGSNPPSPSTSPSVTSDHSYMYKEATRMRESVDDRVSGYLLELAARAAEKQLREQAMAAFPNDEHHEPVDHFIDRDQSESEQDIKRRRESSYTEVNWELVAMQRHREKREQQQASEKEKKKKREAQINKPWGNAAAFFDASSNNNIVGGWQKDGELDQMRKGARPPMLGGDIRFPRCPSPEPARFDPTQGSHALKSAMCYLTEQSQQAENGEGLWCGQDKPSKGPSLWSNAGSRPPSRNGLWGGCCVNSGLTPPRGPTGILTPKVENDNPLDTPHSTPALAQLPPTPPASNPDIASIDEKLATELTIEEEFGDDFVTQVYNYLSLGYPSIACTFDEELARISRIEVSELRQDDHLATSRGYIRLGEDGNLKGVGITEETCVRWRALRVYIHEWARQQPRMVAGGDTTAQAIGTAARRGSWAF
ncbi:uncharacterized protein BDR25DRAFT_234342 [Lindgomyces ingoldianus]|uniref:Uncharacterized protein n=1 Tax=Lindgomyces ingoldianus TaxID=673940 RepID=A0ACB6QL34_9PLEO|nr:uncharacterized protein BDR25DRAFT_234342 [Lindgomyces ingoldianus]KAF2467582.1 hypothetical protein BDR25DRAFT_234342 [Lindgomyces ingoldianus]